MSDLNLRSIQLGDNADKSKNFVIKVPAIADGTLTIERGNGTDVLSIDANGKVTTPGNVVPTFSVYKSAVVQSIPNDVYTKISLQSEDYDVGGCFDNVTNYRFQPTVAGYYFIHGQVTFAAAAISLRIAAIYKNGNPMGQQTFSINANSGDYFSVANAISVYMNGTTDYVELFGYQSSGGSLDALPGLSSLRGFLVRAA